MTIAWQSIFDTFGVKIVTNTDKSKSAYVLDEMQRSVMSAAGRRPEADGPAFDIIVLSDPNINVIKASYYNAERSQKAARPPESRIGRAFISSWLDKGDHVIIGNIGPQLFAAKIQSSSVLNIGLSLQKNGTSDDESIISEVVKKLTKEAIFEKAKNTPKNPASKIVTRNEIIRNRWVVEAALARAEGKCEMPDCTHMLFVRDDDTPYLEVHHINPLGENGPDCFENAAALCPHCHRRLHYGKERITNRSMLAAYIKKLTI